MAKKRAKSNIHLYAGYKFRKPKVFVRAASKENAQKKLKEFRDVRRVSEIKNPKYKKVNGRVYFVKS